MLSRSCWASPLTGQPKRKDMVNKEDEEICYDSEPERIRYFEKQIATTRTTESREHHLETTGHGHQPALTTENEGPETKNESEGPEQSTEETAGKLTSIISKFRHQPTTKNYRKRSSASGSSSSSISLVNKSTKKTSAQTTEEQPISIDYPTLLRLNRCPACDNPWLTYKAPRSKLTHIQKCAGHELIPLRHLTQRIQNILEQQTQQKNQNAGLIDRHLLYQNLFASASDNDHQLSTNTATTLLKTLPEQQPKPSSSKLKKSSSTQSDHSFRSSSLKELHQQTIERNNQVNTKNNRRSYSLWELASGDDDYPYDRSKVPLSPESPDLLLMWPRVKRNYKISRHHHQKKIMMISIDYHNQIKNQEPELRNMPRYEQWTRSELENESERLGYEDGVKLSTSALVTRAQTAWTNEMGCRPYSLGNPASEIVPRFDNLQVASDSTPLPDDEDDDPNDGEEEEDGAINQDDDYYQEDNDLEWENNLLNPQDHDLFLQSDSATSSQRDPTRPFFESFSKAKLELEYAKLARKIEDYDGSSQHALVEVRQDLDKVPKTKPALAKKVLRLWDALYSNPDPSSSLPLNSSHVKSAKSPVKIVKQKVDLLELNRLMLIILNSREPELYLRILRFEPIQLSVLEEKVKSLLDQEFEDRFKAQLLLHQSVQQRGEETQESGGGSSAPSSSDDDDDQIDTKKKKKKKTKKKAKVVPVSLTVTKSVLQIDTLARWLDYQAISYFLLDPSAPRKPRF
ncbi:hypothetical protein PSTT_04730 [Puccinia striiformis]|uniref:Uncharacterized protein n=1 Tax=Puccinia striiformis TaxID=27350 RepID=A0A2S4VRJ8_9BASI|nr:hypothetical protein PSTT_04730 [Puccinia striiformis]